MSIFHKLKSDFVVDKVVRYGASYGWGLMKGYYREKATVGGYGYDLVAGAALTALGSVLMMKSGGHSSLGMNLVRVGDAGVQSYFNSLGASRGAKMSGRTVYVLDAGVKTPKIPAGLSEVLGEIPEATGGAFLTAEDVDRAFAPR